MKRISSGIAIGLAVLMFAPTALAAVDTQDLAKASRFQRKGDRALKSGKVGSAIRAFEQALENVPSFPNAHIGLGQIAMSEKDFERALSHFEKARDGFEELGAALMDIRLKRYSESRQRIASMEDQIRHLESEGAAGGMLQIEITKLQSAISQLQAIEPPDPEEAGDPPGEIYFYIGNALYQLGRRDEAATAWETCREKSPRFALVYNNLALIRFEQGRLEEARKNLDKAEELGLAVNPQFKEDVARAAARQP